MVGQRPVSQVSIHPHCDLGTYHVARKKPALLEIQWLVLLVWVIIDASRTIEVPLV